MSFRRMMLSLVLAGGTIWCLGLVEQAHSEEKAAGDEKFTPIASLEQLTAAQQTAIDEIKKSAAGDSPNLKHVPSEANYIAELFNIKQYAAKADVKGAAAGRDQALALAKAGKDKNKEDVNKLIGPIEEAIKKTGKPADASSPPTEPYKPVSPIKPLMNAQQDFYDEIKKGIDAGKDDDWKMVQAAATMIAELSDVNRRQKPDKKDYVDWATQLRDQSMQIAKAAGAKDADGAKKAMRDVHTTCGACHDKYNN